MLHPVYEKERDPLSNRAEGQSEMAAACCWHITRARPVPEEFCRHEPISPILSRGEDEVEVIEGELEKICKCEQQKYVGSSKDSCASR